MAFLPNLLPVPQVLNGTTAGATAQIMPDPIGTYFGLRMYYTRGGAAATTGQIASDITMIRVNLNGTTQWMMSGAQLQAINSYRGINPDAGEIPLWFHEPYRKAQGNQDFRSWGMIGIDNFTVEVDISGAAPTPVLTCARYWTQIPSVMGEIRKFKPATVPITVAGDNTITTLPRNDRILNLHCNTSIITNWDVKVNNTQLYNHAPGRLHSLFKEYGMTAQAGWQHLAFDYRNRGVGGTESLDPFLDSKGGVSFPPVTLLGLDIKLTTNAATPFTLIRELSGPRD
jgi:hypothetical protein